MIRRLEGRLGEIRQTSSRCETDRTKATGHDEDPDQPIGVGVHQCLLRGSSRVPKPAYSSSGRAPLGFFIAFFRSASREEPPDAPVRDAAPGPSCWCGNDLSLPDTHLTLPT